MSNQITADYLIINNKIYIYRLPSSTFVLVAELFTIHKLLNTSLTEHFNNMYSFSRSNYMNIQIKT